MVPSTTLGSTTDSVPPRLSERNEVSMTAGSRLVIAGLALTYRSRSALFVRGHERFGAWKTAKAMLLAVPIIAVFVWFVPELMVGNWFVTTKKCHWLVVPLVETISGLFAPTRWCSNGLPLVTVVTCGVGSNT